MSFQCLSANPRNQCRLVAHPPRSLPSINLSMTSPNAMTSVDKYVRPLFTQMCQFLDTKMQARQQKHE